MLSLQDRKAAPLRTYSKRKSVTVSEPPSKRQCVIEVSTSAHSNSFNESSSRIKVPQTNSKPDTRGDIRSFLSSSSLPSIPSSSKNSHVLYQAERKKRRLKFAHLNSQISHFTTKEQKPPPKLVQQTIASTKNEFVNCRTCGMVYAFWEEKSHHLYHRTLANEFLPLAKNKSATIYEQEYGDSKLCIKVLDRNSELSLRNIGEKALHYSSDNGLEMETLESKSLWGLITNPHDSLDPNMVPHYRLYTMLHGVRLVALLLAERIGYGVPQNDDVRYQTQQHGFKDQRQVLMSVDRIWVLHEYHYKGLATIILDEARKNFLAPLALQKSDIAISWPTADGNKFFEKYFSGTFTSLDGQTQHRYLINIMDTTAFVKHKEMAAQSI